MEEKEDKKDKKEEKEVKSLVEDLVFLVEVQTKISSDVDLQPHIIKLSNIYQK